MRLYALVAVGGAIGSLGRFWLAGLVLAWTGAGFPWGTVLINILGSFAIGWFGAVAGGGKIQDPVSLQAFAMAGLCGGFTTFSAFSLQTLDLLRAGAFWSAAANVVGSVALCLTATAAGVAAGQV